VIIDQDFTIENDTLTPSMKLKRYIFRHHISALSTILLTPLSHITSFISYYFSHQIRRVVAQKYATIIDNMYDEADQEMAAGGNN
jgi:hypothetical protein